MVRIGDNYTYTLLGTGTTHSYVSKQYINRSRLPTQTLKYGLVVSTYFGGEQIVQQKIDGGDVFIEFHGILVELTVLAMKESNVIFRMD